MALPLYHQPGSSTHTRHVVHSSLRSYRDLTEPQRRRVRLAVTFIAITTALYLALLIMVFVFDVESIPVLAVTHSCVQLMSWYVAIVASVLLSLALWCIVASVKYWMDLSKGSDKDVLKAFGLRIGYLVGSGVGMMLLASWNYKLVGIVDEIVEALTS